MNDRIAHLLPIRAQLQTMIDSLIRLTDADHVKSVNVSLGVSNELTAELIALGAKQRTSVFEPSSPRDGGAPFAVDAANLVIGKVEVRAQCDVRPASADELRQLEQAEVRARSCTMPEVTR